MVLSTYDTTVDGVPEGQLGFATCTNLEGDEASKRHVKYEGNASTRGMRSDFESPSRDIWRSVQSKRRFQRIMAR